DTATTNGVAGCMVVCGEKIDSAGQSSLDSANSATEGLCVNIQGTSTKQLARQLIAAALNCLVFKDDPTCAGTSIGETFAACDAACTAGETTALVGGVPTDCIGAIDAFNNGQLSNCEDPNTTVGFCFNGSTNTGVLCDSNLTPNNGCPTGQTCKPGAANSGP